MSNFNTRVFRPRDSSETEVAGMRQTFSCLSKLGGTTNFDTVPLWPSLVSIYNGLVDFRKFDNFSRFLVITRLKIDAAKDGKDASQ